MRNNQRVNFPILITILCLLGQVYCGAVLKDALRDDIVKGLGMVGSFYEQCPEDRFDQGLKDYYYIRNIEADEADHTVISEIVGNPNQKNLLIYAVCINMSASYEYAVLHYTVQFPVGLSIAESLYAAYFLSNSLVDIDRLSDLNRQLGDRKWACPHVFNTAKIFKSLDQNTLSSLKAELQRGSCNVLNQETIRVLLHEMPGLLHVYVQAQVITRVAMGSDAKIIEAAIKQIKATPYAEKEGLKRRIEKLVQELESEKQRLQGASAEAASSVKPLAASSADAAPSAKPEAASSARPLAASSAEAASPGRPEAASSARPLAASSAEAASSAKPTSSAPKASGLAMRYIGYSLLAIFLIFIIINIINMFMPMSLPSVLSLIIIT